MRFVPDYQTCAGPDGWWLLTPEVVQTFLAELGSEWSRVTTHVQLYNGRAAACSPAYADRPGPMPILAGGSRTRAEGFRDPQNPPETNPPTDNKSTTSSPPCVSYSTK